MTDEIKDAFENTSSWLRKYDHLKKYELLVAKDSEELKRLNLDLNRVQKTIEFRYQECLYMRGVVTTILRQRGEYS